MSELCTLQCYFVVISEADYLTVVGNQTTAFSGVNCVVKQISTKFSEKYGAATLQMVGRVA